MRILSNKHIRQVLPYAIILVGVHLSYASSIIASMSDSLKSNLSSQKAYSISDTISSKNDSVKFNQKKTNLKDTVKINELKELVVESELTQSSANEDVITITKKMLEGTLNTGELIGKIPGAYYNPFNKDIQLNGSSNILLLINGVEKSPDFIKDLRPERFDKITVTYNPTGMYSDYDAVIDMHTKPAYQGYEGQVFSQIQVSPGEENGKDRHLRISNNNGYFTYTRNKFNLDFHTNYQFSQTGLASYFEEIYPLNDYKVKTITHDNKYPNHIHRVNNFNATLATDYQLNNNHSVSAQISITPSSYRSHDAYIFKREFSDNHCDTITETRNTGNKGNLGINVGLWYRGNIDSWRINSRMTYSKRTMTTIDNIIRSTGYSLINERDVESNFINGGMDATHTSCDNKWWFTISEYFSFSNYLSERTKTGAFLSSSHDFRNNLSVSALFQPSKNFSLSMGVGFQIFSNRYNDKTATHVTPKGSVNIMWKPSKKATLRFNYSMIVTNPGLSYLQDYGQFTDSLTYSIGNPDLKPYTGHTASLTATLSNSLTIQAHYNRRTNAIFPIYAPEEGEIPSGSYTYYSKMTYVNAISENWRLNVSYNKSFIKHWQLSITGYVSGYKARFQEYIQDRIVPEASMNLLYYCMNGSFRVMLQYQTGSMSEVSPQTNWWQYQDKLFLSIQKTFCKGKLFLSMLYGVPAHIVGGRRHGGLTSESKITRYWSDNSTRTNNLLNFVIQYRFSGGNKVKKYSRISEDVEI